MSRFVLAPALVVCLLGAAVFTPFLLRERELVAATPSPRPLFDVTFITIPPGEPLCLSDVTIPPEARELRFQARTYGRPGPELAVSLEAQGYAERVTVPAGYADTALLATPIEPPAVARLGTVCIRQRGSAPTALTGTAEERTQSRPVGRIANTVVPADAYLSFYERRSASPLSHLGSIVDRMSAFRPGIVGPWLLWPLLGVVVLGIPAGVLWAAQRAASADGD